MTILDQNEILVEVEVPRMESETGASYWKYGLRGSIDLAIVRVAAVVKLDQEKRV